MSPQPLYHDILIASDEPSEVHIRKASASSDVIVDELDHIGQVKMRMLIEDMGCFF
jgi:hypothetical protein